MRARILTAGLVVFAVLMIWLYSVGLRFPYMNQIPVWDADVCTAAAHMWTRMWWDEGALKMWFSTPYAPRSIEAPARTLYQSWPPGAFVPIYLAAKFLGMQPSIPLVNWVNTVEHGLIALAAAFIVFNLALMNRLGNIGSALVAIGVTFPILLSRGPLYVFSQIYDVTNAVLIYTTTFIMFEVMFYGSKSGREKRIIEGSQLITIYLAFLVDWLSYTLFAFWLISRIVAGYAGIEERMTLRRLMGLALIPISAFSLYLVWRFLSPDSPTGSTGIFASLDQLVFKVMERMNLTQTERRSGFFQAFIEMHGDWFSESTFLVIVVSAPLTLALIVVSYVRARNPFERRSLFAMGSVLMLITVPFYLHMIILSQHTYIHRWAMMKAMFAYALVPFALLPISLFTLLRLLSPKMASWRFGLASASLVLASCAVFYAAKVTNTKSYLMGRIDRDTYLMWDDIGRNTRYADVVVSPVLEANPISQQLGASYKLVHLGKNFSDVDKLVERVCGDFNVVLALPKGTEPGEFASREPAEVVDTGRMRLLRFTSYQGKAIGCS
jgi:hypothetical protein